MKKKNIVLIISMLFACLGVLAQQKTEGYVILVEGDKVYVDFTEKDVTVGSMLEVAGKEEYMVHPVTGEKIRKEAGGVDLLKVTAVHSDYSEAVFVNSDKMASSVRPGVKVRRQQTVQLASSVAEKSAVKKQTVSPADRIPIVIAPTEVNDINGIGYFGVYVSDMLMEKMMMNDRITLLDRSILDAQLNEIDLAGRYIDAATAIEKGKIKGAKFAIVVTMQKPDVVNVKTGVPLLSVMGALQGLTGTNLGAQYFSNTSTERLKSAVDISARVIDMETSEVVFMCSGSGKAQGKVQLGLEYGALGGMQVNGGINGFKRTVTGQAIDKAFNIVANGLNSFFNGETTARVVSGSSGAVGEGLLKVSKRRLYMDTERLGREDLKSLFVNDSDLYFRYKKAMRWKKWSWMPFVASLAPSITLFVRSGFIAHGGEDGNVGNNILGGFLFFGAGATGTALMCWKCNKDLKAIVYDYNEKVLHGRDTARELSFVAVNGGLGLRFSF